MQSDGSFGGFGGSGTAVSIYLEVLVIVSLLYANDFAEIPAALANNQPLRETMLSLIASEPIPGKVTEGGSRTETFRVIAQELALGTINVHQAIRRVEIELPRHASRHADNNRVFADGWAERLVRTQCSRFYNQAVLEQLLSRGDRECYVPHSASEDPGSQCSQVLAGRTHSVRDLHSLLIGSYSQGQWTSSPKIPDHPHCTHVVVPIQPRK